MAQLPLFALLDLWPISESYFWKRLYFCTKMGQIQLCEKNHRYGLKPCLSTVGNSTFVVVALVYLWLCLHSLTFDVYWSHMCSRFESTSIKIFDPLFCADDEAFQLRFSIVLAISMVQWREVTQLQLGPACTSNVRVFYYWMFVITCNLWLNIYNYRRLLYEYYFVF